MDFTRQVGKKYVGSIINLMNRRLSRDINAANIKLQSAEAELDELNQQIQTFEAMVDARLGNLLDQLSELNAETTSLDERLRHIREERLFGTDLMRYLDGAPQPTRPFNPTDLPPLGLPDRKTIFMRLDSSSIPPQINIPDIKVLYRKLARRYHPDLARNDADRALCNEQMTEINQAFKAGDLAALMKLAGMSIPYGVDLHQPPLQTGAKLSEPLNELEQVERKLNAVRQQIKRLGSLPIIKLSLEVKLARHQGRDLLSEMAAGLQYKVRRKIAERDYLQSEINVSVGPQEK
jgi:DNA repair exonuclease SbcCD ATPase subunit